MKTLKQAGIDAKKFEFKSATQASKYPWDAILDGNINVLIEGEDFTAEIGVDGMLPKTKTAARRRYKTVKMSTRDHKGDKLAGTVIVQAFDMTADERTAEDAKRLEEKASFKTRQAAKEATTDTTTDTTDDGTQSA